MAIAKVQGPGLSCRMLLHGHAFNLKFCIIRLYLDAFAALTRLVPCHDDAFKCQCLITTSVGKRNSEATLVLNASISQVKERLRGLFSVFPTADDLPPNSTVFLTFTNGHYSDLMLNSLATIAALGLPAFVYCFDDLAVQLCNDHGIPYFAAPTQRMMESADFRQNAAKFLEMGVHKPEMVQRLFDGLASHTCMKMFACLGAREHAVCFSCIAGSNLTPTGRPTCHMVGACRVGSRV